MLAMKGNTSEVFAFEDRCDDLTRDRRAVD
jgi:hypothetical protein